MKRAIIIHGMPDKDEYYDVSREDSQSNSHWIPWLQQKLSQKDILTQTPEMPEPYMPDYEKWSEVFTQFNLDENTHLIGHSCGAGFLVRWLSENNVKVGKVILVAPWINPGGKYETEMFTGLNIDQGLKEKTDGLFMLYSKDDYEEVLDSVNILKEKVDPEIIEFENKGHFTFASMKTREIPEVLELLM